MSTKNNLFKKYMNSIFIETGSYVGNGIQEALDANFNEIYSIELSDKYFSICKERFKNNKNVHLIKGDSSEVLFDVIKNFNEKITFWLDGHYSQGDTALGKTWSPLMMELDIIKSHRLNTHTIMIDDLRCWKISSEYNFCVDDIIKKLYKINNNYELIYEEGYIENDILVAKINQEKDVILKYIIKQFGDNTSKEQRIKHYSYCLFPEKECTCKDLKEISYNTSLISGGYIDSFSMVVVLMFLEKTFNIKIPDKEATPNNFDTVDKMIELVNKFKK